MKKETLQKGAIISANSNGVAQLKNNLQRLNLLTPEEKKNLTAQFDAIIKRLDAALEDLK